MIVLTTDQLRSLVQLPIRPYQDIRYFDSTSYYDLERYEVTNIFNCSGIVSSSAHIFTLGTDFQITASSVDWTLNGVKPDINTAFSIQYGYSRLSSTTASTACANAVSIATFDLGSKYPYASTSAQGLNTDQLATFIASFRAAAEACKALSVSEIELAAKIRRGSILFDDSKKTSDWADDSKMWMDEYKKYLNMVRPSGMVRGFQLARPNCDNLVLGDVGRRVFDGLFGDAPFSGYDYGGIL